jgi:general secretion pathway protein D
MKSIKIGAIYWTVATLACLSWDGAWAQASKPNVFVAGGVAPTQMPSVDAGPGVARSGAKGDKFSLNFSGAEIESVARAMGAISGKTVVVDPRVKGTMSLVTETPMGAKGAMGLFLSTLRMHGFAAVESGGLMKIVPEADAKLMAGPVGQGLAGAIAERSGQAYGASGGQIVTEVIKLNYESAQALLPVLRPLISPNNTIAASPSSNALIVTDYADNVRRVARIAASLDAPSSGDVAVVQLRYAIASDAVAMVSRMMDTGAQPSADGGRTMLSPDARGNAIVIRASNPARMALAKSLIAKLDQKSLGDNGELGNIYVVNLKNADAAKLAATLRAALGAGGSSSSSSSMPSSAGQATPGQPTPGASGPGLNGAFAQAGPSTGGQIQADVSTNSLVITAPEPLYRQIRAVIDRLDARRAEVYVESLIVEVSADKASNIGVQWQGGAGNRNSNIGVLGTNFGSGGNNILAISAAAASGQPIAPGAGFNFGIAHNFGGVLTLGFLAQFLEQNADANILSTPNLLTLDNEEAKIVIGQNVPFVTGQYTANNSGGGGVVNPFQTIERKDVGLTLRVKPQISENGTVKLSVFQEVSSVDAASAGSAAGLITNKRSIESSVLVEDGSVVVLGGLLQDQFSAGQQKVPGLGDVPVAGRLFKSENRDRKKTNLMVFLRPVIIRDAQSSQDLSQSRYDAMRGAQQVGQPTPQWGFQNGAPALPSQEQLKSSGAIGNALSDRPDAEPRSTPKEGERKVSPRPARRGTDEEPREAP